MKLINRMDLSEKELLIVSAEMQYKKKHLTVSYLLLFITGIFGGHRFYNRRYGTAVTQLILTITFFLSPITLIWLIFDLYYILEIVEENNEEAEKLLINKCIKARGAI